MVQVLVMVLVVVVVLDLAVAEAALDRSGGGARERSDGTDNAGCRRGLGCG